MKRRVTPPVFRWFALADFVAMILIIATGAAVRLTGSGLGCPDWPACFQHQLTPAWSFHPWIEFGNRLVTGSLVVVTAVVFIAALMRTPRRRDLVLGSGLLVVGVFADALLGAIVVYTKLNPYLVALHLILSLGMVVIAAVNYHRSKYLYDAEHPGIVRNPHYLFAARSLWFFLGLALLAGTATTGSGPHAGNFSGQTIARRLPFALQNATWVHSLAAMFFVAVVTGLLLAVWKSPAPVALQKGVRRLVVISSAQALIGMAQYLTHLPALLVELHVLGAVSLTIGVTQFHLKLTSREREPGTRRSV